MKIAIASDHGGFALKQEVMEHLKARNVEYIDKGCYSAASCDYPVFAKEVTAAVTSGEAELGILICGTGIGMSIAANKVKGIRAALCHDVFSAQATREHNDANILCMGARVVGPGLALMIVDTFLDTPFSNDERHIRRISLIED
ncbi:MAG: ribose 5-phosphate isomerase B [Eubacterium sp.]|nr:ribose 5-phosphate isomerase B [Eubacterium sp.]